ncbi:hypothetical protein Bca52824_010971 [Brassica carinata]|uniref:DUF287 domain-containing protein n=1 Tax=Brassica carinata TaxID=52824 RepID=A0A8X7WH39_BRACI|nr:hypothetical protein Bca52824_010971 [Brassica carinata]
MVETRGGKRKEIPTKEAEKNTEKMKKCENDGGLCDGGADELPFGSDKDGNNEEESVDVEEDPEKTHDEELEATETIKPTRMFFYDSEYKKQIKLGTRCMIADVIETFFSLTPEANFKKTEMKGFLLASVNQELDRVKVSPQDIDSILPTRNDEEKALLDYVWEEDDDEDEPDIAVDSWVKRIKEEYTVFFEDMYEEDIAARKGNAEEAVLEDIAPVEEVAEQKKMLQDVLNKMKSLGNQLENVLKTLDDFEERLATVESFVKEAQKGSKKKSKKGSKKGSK